MEKDYQQAQNEFNKSENHKILLRQTSIPETQSLEDHKTEQLKAIQYR